MTESITYDAVIIGGGPAGLACAIRLKQRDSNITVAIVEKGAEIGSHILSGAIIETAALTELLPDWQQQHSPVTTKVTQERLFFLSEKKSHAIPSWLMPKDMRNHRNFIISLGKLCRWLSEKAQALDVDIFTATTAHDIIFDMNNTVIGIKTGERGLGRLGDRKQNYSDAIHLIAKHTFFAEGARGFLSEQLIQHYNGRRSCQTPTYGLGIKELWELPEATHTPGLLQHTIGWPLAHDHYGGGFCYHFDNNRMALGLVCALDYKNPYINPFAEFQRLKHHPLIAKQLHNARRLCFGARVVNEGGWQSLPRLSYPGASIIGCAAGLLNVAKIKGIHNAIRSGMMAAACFHNNPNDKEARDYDVQLRQSVIGKELKRVRNFRPGFRQGLLSGSLLAGIDLKIFNGALPITLKHHQQDHKTTQPANKYKAIHYPPADKEISFSKVDSIYLANIQHEEDQPCHLTVNDKQKAIESNYRRYAGIEQHYCPAGVYEFVNTNNSIEYIINSANCVHCKCCDIKDPNLNITWTPPEGGSGPNYTEM